MTFRTRTIPAQLFRNPTVTQEELTVRQRIIEALKAGDMLSARDISRAVGIREREVVEHLPHIERSIKAHGRPMTFVVEPSRCLACSFTFSKRGRLKTPSRCPVCRSEEITETRFGIVE